MEVRRYDSGETVFREGDGGSCLYHVLQGSVIVTVGGESGDPVRLTELGPGAIFGEMALLEGWPRSATVTAGEEGAELTPVFKEEMEAFLREDPAQVRTLMVNLSHRLRGLTEDYREVCETIREMHLTVKGEKRSQGLLARIGRFLSVWRLTAPISGAGYFTSRPGLPEEAADTAGLASKKYAAGTVVFREGDPGDSMYYLESGLVGIYTGWGTEAEKELTRLAENTFFGEMGLIEKLERSATAVVLDEDTRLRAVTEEDLEKFFRESPSVTMLALRHLSSRLRALTGDYLKACRTVSRMKEAEEEGLALTPEEQEAAERYMEEAMARMMLDMY